ncbi:MAG: tetratricopeptide repeat protein [Acidobacteriota bacterium]|nr:tetratricopeptide repeat protein [Acidobacteriota bacterium]
MLKKGNSYPKIFILAGLFLVFQILRSPWLPASELKKAVSPANFIWLETGRAQIGPVNDSRPAQSSLPLNEKLYLWLTERIEPGTAADLIRNSEAVLNSAGFDLYLLELWLKGLPLKALTLLDSKLSKSPQDPALLNQAGAFLFSLKEYDLAKEFLTAALKQASGHISILNNLAATLSALGLKEEAAGFYQQCLQLDPYHSEANPGLYYLTGLEPGGKPDEKWLWNALLGAYREKIAQQTKAASWPLPLSFEQKINLNLPPLPPDFQLYADATGIFQEALFELNQKEGELKEKLALSQAGAGPTYPARKEHRAICWPLSSSLSYARLLEVEGRLEWLEKEIERPVEVDLSQIINYSVSALESVYRTYRQEEKESLQVPREERPERLKKARDNYCQEYKKQAQYWYLKYRERLLPYFERASSELKVFIPRFYFWLRYLPENQQLSRRLEVELKVIKIYSRLWEKSLWLLTRLGPPAFPDCLSREESGPENQIMPGISLQSPLDELQLEYQSDNFSFSLRASQVAFAETSPALDFPEKAVHSPATIYIYPFEGKTSRPVYLAVNQEGKLNDIGELISPAATRLTPGTSWEVIFNLGWQPLEAASILTGGSS